MHNNWTELNWTEEPTFHIEPGWAGDAIALDGELAPILWLDVGDDEAVLGVVVDEVVLLAVENLQLVLEPAQLGVGFAELGHELHLRPLQHLDVLQFFEEFFWLLQVREGVGGGEDG